ncbi:hypothetical protein FACS189483_10940 [Spirochaetia bacterium]|nr:hypothetical protein FACS189483_10940 [Spirochaetia bacterium]
MNNPKTIITMKKNQCAFGRWFQPLFSNNDVTRNVRLNINKIDGRERPQRSFCMRKNKVMKGLLAAVFAASLVIGMVSCGGGGASPSAVVKNFFAAAEKGDAKKIAEYCTPEAGAMMGSLGEKLTESTKELGKITGTKETIDGDTAKVEVTFEKGDPQTIDLVKVNGKWLVTIKK